MKSHQPQPPFKPPAAIIFDCDGTLVDSERISLAVLAELVNRHGASLTAEEATRRFSGQDLKVVFQEIGNELGNPLPSDIIEQFRAIQLPRLRQSTPPIDGADALLESLDMPFCVASNAPLEKIGVCLDASGLRRHFYDDRIFSAYEVGRWKPDPALFLHAATQMNAEPQNCWVVEDSRFGVDAAVAAGMSTFVFDPHNKFPTSDRWHRIGKLRELSRYLSRSVAEAANQTDPTPETMG